MSLKSCLRRTRRNCACDATTSTAQSSLVSSAAASRFDGATMSGPSSPCGNSSGRQPNASLASQQQPYQTREDVSAIRSSAHSAISSPSSNSSHAVERRFMKLSKLLASKHSSQHRPSAAYTQCLLRETIPTRSQRQEYYLSLQRNVAYLPMFPVPNEHPSFAITRYVEREFGPLLAREMDGGSRRSGNADTSLFASRSPPVECVGGLMFPPPSSSSSSSSSSVHPTNDTNTQQSWQGNAFSLHAISPMSPGSAGHHALPTPRVSNGGDDIKSATPKLSIHIPPFSPHDGVGSSILSATPMTALLTSSNTSAQRVTTSSSLPETNILKRSSDPSASLESEDYSMCSLGRCHNISNREEKKKDRVTFGVYDDGYYAANKDDTEKTKKCKCCTPMANSPQYERLSSKEMLPPIIPRDKILYYPDEPIASSSRPTSPCFCGTDTTTLASSKLMTSALPRKKKPSSYLQLYIKCERSEPFFQPHRSKNTNDDMDIVTWYRNVENHVTADRTLVVKGTTSLFELIQGIVTSFGLNENDINGEDSTTTSLGCYNGICFVSDIKSTISRTTSQTQLTPFPIPGFYYKYVERSLTSDNTNSKRGSTVLSNDPAGLQRTLVAQLLDKPIYPSSSSSCISSSGNRSRMALVYCTPKRQAYASCRTEIGTMPETIYHFQILLEGIVDESDLTSSFQSQTALRCVRSTGGVQGGSLVDSPEEIDDLNRKLWGDKEVVGLVSPSSNRAEDREHILDYLALPLFDETGTQALKEFVVDRCLYNLYSGKISMEMARHTQQTVHVVQGTSDWLTRQVEGLAKTVANGANAVCSLDDELGEEFDAAVSRMMLGRDKSKW
eukprot:g1580.t1 g1580   contig10:2380676-2383296(-)